MTFDQIKAAYLNESFGFAMATEEQVIKLSNWLDANNYHNAAHTRWDDYQEELRELAAEFD